MNKLLTVILSVMLLCTGFTTIVLAATPEETIQEMMKSAKTGKLSSEVKLGDKKEDLIDRLTLRPYNGSNYYEDNNNHDLSYRFDDDEQVTYIRYSGEKIKNLKLLDTAKVTNINERIVNNNKWILEKNVYDDEDPEDEQYITAFYDADGEEKYTMTKIYFIFPIETRDPSMECVIISND